MAFELLWCRQIVPEKLDGSVVLVEKRILSSTNIERQSHFSVDDELCRPHKGYRVHYRSRIVHTECWSSNAAFRLWCRRQEFIQRNDIFNTQLLFIDDDRSQHNLWWVELFAWRPESYRLSSNGAWQHHHFELRAVDIAPVCANDPRILCRCHQPWALIDKIYKLSF